MDNKKNGIPKLRFPGFTGAWEQRKLGEEFKKVNERNNGEFGKDRWISVAKMYFQDPDKVTSNNIDTRTYVMRLGDIAFEGHPNNEFKFGRFVANDIGDGVVSELFPIYRHIRDYDNNYWKYAIHLERIMGPIFAKSITSSGNSSNKLAPKDLLRQSIFLPHLDEQKQIGYFFKQFDSLIALHQRKLEHLQEQKKGLLQKMFPKNGETVPEVRFPGFTDAWEQRKLGDVATFKQGVQVGLEKQYTEKAPGRERFIRIVDYTQKTEDIRYIDKIPNANYVDKNDVVVVRYGAAGFVGHGISGIIANNMFTVNPFENLDKTYLYTYIKQDKIRKYLNSNSGSSTMPAINFNIMKTLPIPCSSIVEQKRIAGFFQQLDTLIALHQRKLEHLELMKKGLLQQMFV